MSYAARVLESGPSAYWRLNEASGTSAVDATGNGRTGTIHGGPTFGAAGAPARGVGRTKLVKRRAECKRLGSRVNGQAGPSPPTPASLPGMRRRRW